MSITRLHVEALPPGSASLDAWLRTGERWLDEAATIEPAGVDDAGLVDVVRRLTAIAARVAAVKLAVVAQVDARSAARRVTGATSTAAWLRADGESAGAASRQVALAGSLLEHEATRKALSVGQINLEQAQVIAGALDALSDTVTDADKTAVEQALLTDADRLDPGRLRKQAVAQAARIDPTGSGDLAGQERSAKAGRDLTMWRGTDGMHHLRGVLDTEAAAIVAAALDPLAAPSPAVGGGKDTRTPGRRRADALIELSRRALTGGRLPVTGGVRPQVVVTMTSDQLRGQIDGCAQIGGATVREPLSAAAARRIACDAELIPVVLGGGSQILDWGRALRTATPTQRRALAVRDGGCTAPGCDRPPEWCEAHHLIAWEHGGATDLANMTLVCDAHHDIAHHDGWTITISDTDTVVWHPPPTPPPEPPW